MPKTPSFDEMLRETIMSTSVSGTRMDDLLKLLVHNGQTINKKCVALEAENLHLRKEVNSMSRQISLLFSISKGENRTGRSRSK